MLYGEGKKAFLRLQEGIIKHSDDHTIFAWKGIKHDHPGMLALEPDDFASYQNLVNIRVRKGRKPYNEKDGSQRLMGIFLRRLDEDDQYARVSISGTELVAIPQPKDGLPLLDTMMLQSMSAKLNFIPRSPLLWLRKEPLASASAMSYSGMTLRASHYLGSKGILK